MPCNEVRLVCTVQTFKPQDTEGLRWWQAGDWADAYSAHEGMWPDSTPWAEEEWHELYSQDYRYCSLLVNSRAVAAAGLWQRTDHEWEVIAVGTAPGFRNQGYGKAVVSFVTRTILEEGRVATIHTETENTAMLRAASAVGYEVI